MINAFILFYRLDTLDSVYRTHKLERDTAHVDIGVTEKNISTCKESAGELEERYRFFQEMRGYVRDLVECLNEKVGEHIVLGGIFNVVTGLGM